MFSIRKYRVKPELSDYIKNQINQNMKKYVNGNDSLVLHPMMCSYKPSYIFVSLLSFILGYNVSKIVSFLPV